jgi:hypothetical protein
MGNILILHNACSLEHVIHVLADSSEMSDIPALIARQKSPNTEAVFLDQFSTELIFIS